MSVRCTRCLQYYDQTQVHQCTYIENYPTLRDFLFVYKCERCCKYFTGLSNSGLHKCKYHPGEIGRDGKYTCCGGGRSYHTNPNVYNMVWTRNGLRPPPIRDLSPGCMPCDHFNRDSPVKLPLDPDDPNYIHLLAHLKPSANERPGWDGTQLWPHPTFSTAVFQVQEEKKEEEKEGLESDVAEDADRLTDIDEDENDEDENDEDDDMFF